MTKSTRQTTWAAANTGLLLQRLDEQFESSVVSFTFVSWDSGRNTKPLQHYAPRTLGAIKSGGATCRQILTRHRTQFLNNIL